MYINKGTVNVTGSVTGNGADNGGAVYQVGGTLTVSGSMNQNTASVNGGAVYVSNGTLTVEAGGSLSGNSATGNGGAVYQEGGTEEGAGNSAANGGAIYTSGTTLSLNGASFTKNSATTNGGAIYALNANTVIGGTWTNNAATAGTKASFNGNSATGNGGALYMEGGSATVMNANSTLSANKAENGGAIYATSGAITVENGNLESNEANANGGAIYADSASVTVKGGTLGGTGKGNKAKQGNGGAIYSGSSPVTISGGTLAGNSASKGESTADGLGLGGAVYAGSSTVNYTGGNINGGNSAVNGAAIYVGSGIANVSASITGNTATNGGAIGVGGTSARLYFKGNAEVNNNTMNGAQSNVYLDVDSELVVNADSLNNGKKIGIYVPGDVNSDQVIKHGDVTGYFGAYVSAGTLANISNVFKSDRFSDLKVAYENNRVYWYKNFTYDIYYLKNYDSQFPPTSNYTSSPSKKVCSNKTYAPRTRRSDIYDLVMAMKLYEKHVTDFENNVDKTNYASLAVYAYTYSDKAMYNSAAEDKGFSNYLKSIEWDAVARNWKFIKQDGTTAENTSKLVIFYSAPAYLTIVNNNESGLELDISEIKVLGKNAGDGVYGFVTAKNGATVTTLRTLTKDDLNLNAGDSIKLMFPGAQGQKYTLKGTFTGEGAGEGTSVTYTINGGAEQTLTGMSVDFSGDSYELNTNDEAVEIVFGDALPICKIGNEPFSTLKAAMDYAKDQKAATGNNTYTIEMLVDYLVPKDDVLEIPAGYDITFTTADRNAETLPYRGNGTRATLSRDTGNEGASVMATNSTLTVDNLAFDGRSLAGSSKGGAVSAESSATVTITNCEFKGYRAGNGGAIYVNNTSAGSKLTVEHCQFSNCQTNAKVDKAGGGGIWTTARELYVRRCDFDFCACLAGNAQAGSIFHNIRSGWAPNSKTVISDCTFSNSYSVGGSGGTIETDALEVTIDNCEFHGSYTNKSQGNGGAINALAGDAGANDGTGWAGNYDKECRFTVKNCLFEGCRADNNGNGGAIVSSMWYVTVENCKFVNTQAKYGGAVKMTNKNAKELHINGCTFENCTATDKGGGVYAPVPEIKIEKSAGGTFLDNTHNDGTTYFIDCTANRGGGIDNAKDNASVTMQNVHFTRCVARTSNGGALYTQAKTLSITGDTNSFEDCTGWGSGGAVYQYRNVDGSKVELENCVFTGCEAFNNGSGGGMYANARTLTVNYDTVNNSAIEGAESSFVNCTAANAGGGLYHDYAGTAKIANCGFEGCIAKAAYGGGLYTNAYTLNIIGADSKFKNCTAQTDGGGLYHNRDANGPLTLMGASFESCTATGNYGGAIYTKDKGTVTLEGCTVKDSTAKSQGGGIYFANGNTASFDGCTITGNTVTNSDSKGGGVYVPGGTTTYVNSTISGCEAAYGGGWYQNNGNLYILGGSISGSAVNGGGLYMYDSNTKVYHYGGTVGGTATANGGGVYKANGGYTLGNGTYNEIEYTDGASIGGRITLPVIVNGEETTETVDSSAVNGGGVYQAGGSFTMNAGASIGSVETGENGEIVYTATATGNGGGIYIGGSWVKIFGGVITNCQADGNGGGIYLASTGDSNDLFFYGDADTKIQNCSATNGGGVYVYSNTFQFGENGKTSFGAIENCRATGNGGGVYQEGGTFNHRNTSEIIDCTADNDGGGVYQAGGTFNQYDTSSIAGCSASNNGGGVYHAGGTFTFSGGSIIQNGATVNGGGVYHAGGAFSMTNAGAVIGGSEENANTANVGAGVFVADGQAATFNGSTVTYNHALTAGGGIAVGGPDAALTFQNAATVRNNTMGSQNTECNVYLDQDRNTIIKNNALNANAYIGVYASDDQDAGHGVQGMPFATWNTGNNNDKNLNVYHNDRRPYLYGMKGSTNNEVIWPKFVCKITDGAGNLLYKDASGTPAVYAEVENRANSANNSAGAFTALNVAGTPSLYKKDAEGNYALYNEDGKGEYQVQMLVENYEMGSTRQIKLDVAVARKVTLTTASPVEDECGFKYTGDPRFPATITRTADTSCMVFVGGTDAWELTLSNITLDGGNKKATEEGAILRVANTGKAILDSGATLKNGLTNNKEGGAVYLKEVDSVFTMNAGSQIKDCSAGTSNGGAVAINNGTFTMNAGSSITGCSAANGGGVWMNNASKLYMNGGTITGNSATGVGGGIALVNSNARAYFSGYCTVTGNTLNGTTRCNVQFNQDSNAIINAKGLDSRSEIGVYTANGTILTEHGESGDPFGTWSEDGDKLFCFVNDRSRNLWNIDLRGFESAVASNHYIYWEYHPLLTVFKEVESDWSYDRNEAEFTFEVRLPGKTSMTPTERNSIKGMSFGSDGQATVTLKAGESATAEFPNNYDKFVYEVKEVLSSDAQADYKTAAEQNGTAYAFAEDKPLTVSGKLGENIGTANSSSLSTVSFTNTRNIDTLTIKAKTVSTVESDYDESFDYTLTLGDTTINKAYPIGPEGSTDTLTFTAGVATFTLKDDESITIRDLPTDLPYTVVETLNEKQKTHIRTQVSRNGVEPVYTESQVGTIGEGKPEEVEFTNNFLEIVCKITNRSRALLYYRDAAGNLQPAIFAHLEDAFDQVNSGNLRTAGNGTVSGQLRIEMVVPEYTMERGATLIAGKNVLLSTALPTDKDGYPYNKGMDDGADNVSVVTRGYDGDSMIVTDGAFTIDKITLDGGADVHNATVNGGIVKVNGAIRLTVNSGATLQNASTSGNGGAIWLNTGASLAMNGTVQNCSATAGGGVYADTGFTGFTVTGAISGCNATNGNGGAIYASSGSSVNLNAGTVLTGNAARGDGGAVWSAANLILRGTVGGTEENDGNKAGGSGGGICMGENTTFTMYAGSGISGNQANNGGGLATAATARIAGGTLQENTATENGGALYGGEGSVVSISGTSSLTQNGATHGGAVYDGGSVTMTGGAMTGNTATEKGGAVYVAEAKTFTISGGSIKDGNKSPEGAVSTGSDAVLVFSGNVVVRGNTDADGANAMNVYLGFDSNSIITTTGLGANADIGVYVADGDPEDPETVEDAVVNPIYSDHGMSSRNFGTYTGGNVGGARLGKFVNDRDTTLTGMAGAAVTNGNYVVWTGKGLQLRVYKVDSDGKQTRASGIRFALLTNESTQMTVWSGSSDATGLVTIPWGAEESENGKAATFAPYSSYTLRQVEANAETVLPAGSWLLTIGRDNSVTWSPDAVIGTVNQTIAIALPGGTEKGYLGDTFDLYNDTKPTLTYNATGGKLSGDKIERTDTIKFTTQETYHEYTITETNPTWDSHVFRTWATKEKKPEGTDEQLIEQGYFEYDRGSNITFFRGTEDQKNTQGTSTGDMILYAQWDEVVCKITDRDGKILYVNGTLEAGFEAYNAAGSSTFTYITGGKATARRIEMLVPTYTLNEPVSVARGKTVTLTTAPTSDTDGYKYTGRSGTVCVITRGESCDGSMISNYANLTLMNITLDGGNRQVTCDGGFVNNAQTSAVLTITNGATLRNSVVDGNGGAVNAPVGTRVNITGGTIIGNSASGFGGAIYSDGKGVAARKDDENSKPTYGLAVTNCTISNNTAKAGGAVYLGSNANAGISGCTISGNTAVNGGAIYNNSPGLPETNKTKPLSGLTISSGTISGNTASSNGGAVYLAGDATASMSGGSIYRSTAERGAGVFAANNASMEISGGNITNNEAVSGGGVGMFNDSSMTMLGGTISGNRATNGGGVYTDNSATLDIQGGDIHSNTATANGGGVYHAAGVFALSGDGKITSNDAANGGGVFNSSDGVVAEGDEPGVPGFILSGGSINNNKATVDGAGIYVASGSADLSGGSVTNNNASGNGGAVFLASGAKVTLEAGTTGEGESAKATTPAFTGNSAVLGGAAYVDNGGILNMSAGSITGNTATDTNGGAINVGGENARLNFSGNPVVYGNPAANGQQKNVVLSEDTNDVIHANGLNEDAHIGVYVPVTNLKEKHGEPGTPFGTIDNNAVANLDRFVNDWNNAYYGVQGSTVYGVDDENAATTIYWAKFICEITDSTGNTLSVNSKPALYTRLNDAFRDFATATFDNGATPTHIKMLVDYAMPSDDAVEMNTTKAITFTTAPRRTEPYGAVGGKTVYYYYTGTGDAATITRGDVVSDDSSITTFGSMFTQKAGTLTLTNLELDGGAVIDAATSENTGKSTTANGGIIHVTAGRLNIQTGTTLQNSITTGNGGAVYMAKDATAEMTGGTITGSTATNGGAVYVVNGATMALKDGTVGTGSSVKTTSATINANTATDNGAGIYLEEGAKLNLQGHLSFGGTGRNGNDADAEIITEETEGDEIVTVGNFVDTAVPEKAQNGQKDYKKFRQDIYVAGYQGLRTGTKDPMPATSIVVTGKIVSTDEKSGYIWVAAEKPDESEGDDIRENNHYQMLKQFAVFAAGVTPDEATMQAFRNAWDDESTGCGADYLTGQDGDDLKDAANKTWKCIYWTGGFDFVFRKLKEDGQPLDGAKFTLFMAVEDPANSGKFVPAKKDTSGKLIKATSTDETTWAAYEQSNPDKMVGGKVDATAESKNITEANAVKIKYTKDGGTNIDEVSVYGDGLAVFEKIPPGVYFMVEKVRTKKKDGGYDIATGAPLVTGKTVNYQAVEEMYRVVIDGKGYYTIQVAKRNATTGQPEWDAAVKSGKVYTWPNAKNAPTVKLTETANNSKVYTDEGKGTATIDLFTAMNVSPLQRKVILKKVDGDTYTPLSGATFTVFYADRQTPVRVENGKDASGKQMYEVLENKASGAGGAFWIGKLPYGTYYLHETTVPDGFKKLNDTNDNWFILTVNEAGVGYLAASATAGTKPSNEIKAETTKP